MTWLLGVLTVGHTRTTFSGECPPGFSADAFPGTVDAMFNIDEDPYQETRWRVVRERMPMTAFIIQSAASTLVDVLQF